jgi:integrase
MARYKKRADGLYQKQITITVKGKKKQKAFYAKTIPELERKVREYRQEEESNNLTFQAVADEWWEEHEKTLEYNTLHGYVAALKSANQYFGDIPIDTITAMDINEYLKMLQRQKYAQKTIANKFQIVRQVFAYAVLCGYVPVNVSLSVSIPKKLKKQKREPASYDDISKIKNSNNLFAKLALYTGCRRGELLGLKYEDIDFDKKQIHIVRSVYHEGDKPKIKTPKTEAGNRIVPLIPELEKMLTKPKKGYIINFEGNPLTKRRAETMIKNMIKELDLSCTLHQIRHAYATRLYELGIDVKSAQYIMGHADISTTQNIYTHISERKMVENIKKLEDF